MLVSPQSESDALCLLARNPVFTATKNVWGYEIQTAIGTNPALQQANIGAAITAGDYVGLNDMLARNKKLLLAYTSEQIVNHTPYVLPAKASAILLDVDQQQDTTLHPMLQQLVSDGHTLALDWHCEITPASPLLPQCGLIVLAQPEDADQNICTLIAAGKTCLSRNVLTIEQFEQLRKMNVSLFQGKYFKTPEIIPGRKLSTQQNSRFQIMRLVESEDPDLDQIAKIIQSDVSLSYRLLSYLNSPTFGIMRKVDSIHQAASLLGWNNLRNWLRAMLLAEMSQSEQQTELLHLSLQRGKFLEMLVRNFDYWDFKPDEMFLLGMFSLLDAILGIPMAEALEYLPLTEAQKKALRGENCEYLPLMHLVLSLEDLGGETSKHLADVGLDADKIFMSYYEASAWAASILHVTQAK